MNTYTVNATMTVCAWVTLEANDPDEALDVARSYRPSDFEYDLGTAEVEFDVTPAVEVES